MGKIKKISAVILSCLTIFSVCSFSFFAEPLDITFQQYAQFWRTFDGSTWSGFQQAVGSSGVTDELPFTGNVNPFSNQSVINFEYFFGGSILLDGFLDTIKPGWTYTASFTVRLAFPFKKLTFSDDLFSYDLMFCQSSVASPGNYTYPVSGLFETFASDLGSQLVSSNDNYHSYDIYLAYVFNVPLDYSLPDSYTWLFSSLSLVDPVLYSSISPYTMSLRGFNLSGTYDPSGADASAEVDLIIQGQKDAAQYALDQEQIANEEALQGALDDANTDDLLLSEKFGGGLVNLYNALTYSGTTFSIKLPASGTVPFLNTDLWSETEIPIKEYIDKVPSAVWVVVNFILWFVVAFSIIHLVHKIIDWINGHSFKD